MNYTEETKKILLKQIQASYLIETQIQTNYGSLNYGNKYFIYKLTIRDVYINDICVDKMSVTGASEESCFKIMYEFFNKNKSIEEKLKVKKNKGIGDIKI